MATKYILIVDDDKEILNGFKSLLETKGYKASTAESGREAIDKALDNFYNLALIDIKLPDMPGTELLSEFKKLNPGMKKIMVTGYASQKSAIESLNLGADGYLVKPVTPGKLISIVADKLEEQQIETDIYENTVNDLLIARMQEGHSNKDR